MTGRPWDAIGRSACHDNAIAGIISWCLAGQIAIKLLNVSHKYGYSPQWSCQKG